MRNRADFCALQLFLLLLFRLFAGQMFFERRATKLGGAGLLIGVGQSEQIGFAEKLAGEGNRAGLVVRAFVLRMSVSGLNGYLLGSLMGTSLTPSSCSLSRAFCSSAGRLPSK